MSRGGTPAIPRAPSMKTGRRFAWRLTALLATAGFLRALLLWEFWSRNPFALLPYSDGELYWNRAGEMAAGQWLEPTPFLIAPLYPYLLGTLRTLGGGLPTLYALQTLMHLATAGLVGDATRRRLGAIKPPLTPWPPQEPCRSAKTTTTI